MILSLLQQIFISLPLVLGAYITLSLLKLPDFSIEGAYLFGAVMAFLAKDFPFPIILLSAFSGGMGVGFLVCILNRYLHLPFLLAAIVTNGLLHGLTQHLLGTSMQSFHPILPFHDLPLFACMGVSLLGLCGLGIRSHLGYSLAIYGNNPHFFRNHSLSGNFVLFSGVMIGHGCAGIGGFLFAVANGFVDLTMNFGIILLCLTSLIFGKMLIRTSRPHILVPLVGIICYFFVQQTVLRMGLNLKYFNSFQALIILSFLYFGHRHERLKLDHLGV